MWSSSRIQRTKVRYIKSKGKDSPYNSILRLVGWVKVYNSTQFKTSALKTGVGGQHHAPAALPPRKTRYPLYKRLGGSQGRSERARKNSPPNGIRPPDRAARTESLHRLSYSGRHIRSIKLNYKNIKSDANFNYNQMSQ